MNAMRESKIAFWCLFQICAAFLIAPIASAEPGAPQLWTCVELESGGSSGWPFLWREIDKKCLTNLDSEAVQTFVGWHPPWAVVDEDIATLYFFVWVRLIDRGYSTSDAFSVHASELYGPASILFVLYSNPSNTNAIESLKNSVANSLNSDGGGYSYSLLMIRILGLVPRNNMQEAQQFLEELALPLGGPGKATGQYGEEILEMVDLLNVR